MVGFCSSILINIEFFRLMKMNLLICCIYNIQKMKLVFDEILEDGIKKKKKKFAISEGHWTLTIIIHVNIDKFFLFNS